jgi:hypothetical protein
MATKCWAKTSTALTMTAVGCRKPTGCPHSHAAERIVLRHRTGVDMPGTVSRTAPPRR